MTPESRALTGSSWYGNHTAAEDVTLTAHGKGTDGGSSSALHDEIPFTLNAGTPFSIEKMSGEHAFVQVAGETIVIARSEIGKILVQSTSL